MAKDTVTGGVAGGITGGILAGAGYGIQKGVSAIENAVKGGTTRRPHLRKRDGYAGAPCCRRRRNRNHRDAAVEWAEDYIKNKQ